MRHFFINALVYAVAFPLAVIVWLPAYFESLYCKWNGIPHEWVDGNYPPTF